MYIDAHQHFWHYNLAEYDWIDEGMSVLRQDFLPKNLAPILEKNNFTGSVVVQARQSLAETQWLLSLAEEHSHILGVVGWIDLLSDDLPQQLDKLKGNTWLKGFRHVLQGEDADFMLQPKFINALKVLADYHYSYDILVHAKQLPQVCELVAQLPDMKLVIDHIAKPDIKNKLGWSEWLQAMGVLAKRPNVSCKLSGMVTEADWLSWQAEDIEPYMRAVCQLFGPKRVMFGSDWPVCNVATDYTGGYELVKKFLEAFYKDQPNDSALNNVFRNNVVEFYNLDLGDPI